MSDQQAHRLAKRSTYILDGATNKLGPEEVPFTMELLYLLLPIIGAFVLLFSVCCCGKTLKKMLHIPKEVVMGSYAAMQMQNNSTRASSDSDSSSSDDEDEGRQQLQGVQNREQESGNRQGVEESEGQDEARGCSASQLEVGVEVEEEQGQGGQNADGSSIVLRSKEQQDSRNRLYGTERQNRRTVSEPAESLSYVPETSESAHLVNNGECVSIECEANADNPHPFSVVIIPRCDINNEPKESCDTSSNKSCQYPQCVEQQSKYQCNAKPYCNKGEEQTPGAPKHSKPFCGCSDITPGDSVHKNCAKSQENPVQCKYPQKETSELETLDARLLDKTCAHLPLPETQTLLSHCHNVDKKELKPHRPFHRAKNRFHKPFKKCPHGRCVSRDQNGGRSRGRKRASRDHLPLASLSQSCPLLTVTAVQGQS